MTFEKQVAMPDLKNLVSTLWFTCLLALLASVVVAPRRTSGFVTVSSRPDCLRRDFGLSPGRSTMRLSKAMATDAVLEVDAFASESKEQERAGALDEPRVSFLIPCSFRKLPDRHLIAPRSILSLYPLRC
ncbi:MAG: hypothetical protein ACLQGP_24595 [Isosphaeraceae bacterium]